MIWSIVGGIATPGFGQSPAPPPGFGRNDLIVLSEQVSNAWDSWQKSDAELEQRIFSLPMTDARARIQRALSGFLAYLDRRRQYSDAAASYIESSRLNPEGKSGVGVEVVSADQLQVMGVSLTRLQQKLDALRTASAWAQIRRNVLPDRSDVLTLQSSRRDDITVDRPLDRARPAIRTIASIVYADSERQMRDALQKLWTRYYQSLADAVEQKPAGSAPLMTRLPANAAVGADAPVAAETPNAPSNNNPLVGTWIYPEGSQRFNGVAAPHQVMLELWMEQGLLLGRYRADLPTFDGAIRHVDLKLQGRFAPDRDQTLEFRSSDPDTAGKVVIEGLGVTGLDLMLVRVVESGSPIPRGRENLSRR